MYDIEVCNSEFIVDGQHKNKLSLIFTLLHLSCFSADQKTL